MQPIETSSPVIAPAPVAVPPHEPPTTASDSTTEISAALPSIRDRFSKEVMPLISSIRDSERIHPHSGEIRQLRALVESPELRAVIWEHIGSYGIPYNLSLTQRQALAVSMTPYVSTDREQSWNAILRITDRAVTSSDMLTYELVGKTVLGLPLPNAMIELFALSFVKYETHNASKVPALSPWIQLFSEKASADTCVILAENLIKRLHKGEVSSYDHILTVLCQTQNPVAVHTLRNSSTPPMFNKKMAEPPVSLLAGLGVCEMVVMLPVAAIATYALGGFESVMSVYTPALAGTLAAIRTLTTHRPALRALTLEDMASAQAFIRSFCYGHYVDHLFSKLCALSAQRAEVTQILNAMESHPFFANKLAEWRQLRAHSAN